MSHQTGPAEWMRGGMPELTIPAPMAFFGMVVGMMTGFLFGMMFGKKKALMMMGHMKGMKGYHHHHGYGMGPCCGEHGGEDRGEQSGQEWSSRGGNQEEPRDEGE